MLIKSDSASVSAIKATLNNAHFIFIATNCGRHQVLLVSKWTHRYLFKRDSLLPSISFKEIPETRKQEILLLRISFVNHFVLLILNFRFIILKRSIPTARGLNQETRSGEVQMVMKLFLLATDSYYVSNVKRIAPSSLPAPEKGCDTSFAGH